MNGLLILGVLLFITGQSGAHIQNQTISAPITKTMIILTATTPTSTGSSSTSKEESKSAIRPVSTTTTSLKAATGSVLLNYKSECRELYIVSGILFLISLISMISTLILLCKVCQLRRCLSTDGEPFSNNEYWVGTDNKDQSKPDSEREAKESTMLMADLSPAQGETNNGTIKEDGEKVKEDEQKPEEKEVVDAANSEEASATPVTAAENSPSPKTEVATDAQPSQAVEAASSEGKEEPDVEKK